MLLHVKWGPKCCERTLQDPCLCIRNAAFRARGVIGDARVHSSTFLTWFQDLTCSAMLCLACRSVAGGKQTLHETMPKNSTFCGDAKCLRLENVEHQRVEAAQLRHSTMLSLQALS